MPNGIHTGSVAVFAKLLQPQSERCSETSAEFPWNSGSRFRVFDRNSLDIFGLSFSRRLVPMESKS